MRRKPHARRRVDRPGGRFRYCSVVPQRAGSQRRMSALEKETELNLRATAEPRYDWTRAEVEALYALPFNDLLFRAHSVHRQCFDPNAVQTSTLLSIKT